METIEKKKENPKQVTFRDPEIWDALKKLSEETDNSGVGPKAKELIKAALQKNTQQAETAPVVVKEEKSLSVAVEKAIPTQESLEVSAISKLDIIGNLLLQLLAASNDQESEETQEKIEEAVTKALEEQEEELRGSHLMLSFTEKQTEVIINLFEHRKAKDKKLVSIESLFFELIREQFYSEMRLFSTSEIPAGFDKEFRDAFEGYFNPGSKAGGE